VPILRPPREDLNADIQALIEQSGSDLIEVTGPQALHIGPAGSIAGGRGMLIVDAIADEWGVTARSAGKEVWFRLRTTYSPILGTCKCPTSTVLTPGGLPLHVEGP
jgi:hypothetical protein